MLYQIIIKGFMVRNELTNHGVVATHEAWWLDDAGPHLAEETDEQAWVTERIMTKPQGEIRNPTEATCSRANGFQAGSWGEADYAEMASSKTIPAIAEGAKVDPWFAALYFRQIMASMSAPVSVIIRNDPWSLRGDRAVVPETMIMEQKVEEPSIKAKLITALLGAQHLVTAPEVVEVDPEIALQYAYDAVEALLVSSYRKPSGVDDVGIDEDDEPAVEKPLAQKPTEPPFRPKYDDWGFPIKYPSASTDPTTDSEPPPNSANGEPVPEESGESPPPDQLGTDGSAARTADGTGSSTSHYESIEPALRAAIIEEKGMKTRIQLTGYLKGKYVQGQADNFIVPDIMAEAVQAALATIKEIASKFHLIAVGAGTAPAKGGPRVRIQLTEYATNGGEYLRQDGSTSKPQNLTVPGMSVVKVAELVDHQLALHFGVRRGDANALVKAWGAFAGIETVDGSAGPVKKDDRKDERGASDSVTGNSGNTVQGALLDGYGAIEKPLALLLPDLLGRTYSKLLHLGLCAVVTGSMLRVISLWEREADAKVAARRAGGRVVDAQGFLVPQGEVEAAEIAPDEVRA